MDRRTVLMLVAAGAIAPASGASESDPLVINALGSLANPNPPSDPSAPRPRAVDARAIREARASGLTAVNVTLGYVAGTAEPFEQSIRGVARWDAMIRAQSSDLIKVWTADDILKAKASGRIGIIYGFQNATMMGDKVDRVDFFADLGVRVVQLTYNPANQLGDGAMAPENRGLTPFGRQVVERLNANRIMVDLSHSGERTCLEAARMSRQPISINHTGCRALVDLPRNKSNAELRLVAETGGFVGIYFMPFLSASRHAVADDVVAHIEHAFDVCGEDHVGIGTDGPISAVDDLGAYRAGLAREVQARQAAGIAASGERADTLPFVIDLRGPDQFRDLASRLQRRGHSTTRVEKLLGRNFLRYAQEIWGG